MVSRFAVLTALFVTLFSCSFILDKSPKRLKANKGDLTPDNMVAAFESLPSLNLALGASARFSPANHQYSQSVWGTGIQPNGSFSNT